MTLKLVKRLAARTCATAAAIARLPAGARHPEHIAASGGYAVVADERGVLTFLALPAPATTSSRAGQRSEVQKNQKVGVFIDLENTKTNNLGIPLPGGRVVAPSDAQ